MSTNQALGHVLHACGLKQHEVNKVLKSQTFHNTLLANIGFRSCSPFKRMSGLKNKPLVDEPKNQPLQFDLSSQ